MQDDTVRPFQLFDYHGNVFVVEHGNVATNAPTTVTLWPARLWDAERERRRTARNDGCLPENGVTSAQNEGTP